jgi:hypothetical protein
VIVEESSEHEDPVSTISQYWKQMTCKHPYNLEYALDPEEDDEYGNAGKKLPSFMMILKKKTRIETEDGFYWGDVQNEIPHGFGILNSKDELIM